MGTATQEQEAPADVADVAKPAKLTVTSAVDEWSETTAAIEVLSDRRKTAAEFLLAHGLKTGRRAFLGRVAMERTGGSLVFDQAQAKKDLEAAGYPIPKKRTKLGWTLKFLK